MNTEAQRRFECFGGTVSVHVRGESRASAEAAAERARSQLLDAHRCLSRFIEDSELSELNRDPRREVPASPLLRELAAAVAVAGAHSGGLVDATLLGRLEDAGYRESLSAERLAPLDEPLAPPAQPAGPDPAAQWQHVHVDAAAGTIVRPPGVRIDSGGIAKGLLADRVGASLRGQRAYAVDCCGDVSVGGRAGLERAILVADPAGGDPIHELRLRDGAVATSGIGRRSWIAADGTPAHHILDPRSGRPAFTGIVQATALAPTALLAEIHAKAALLSGPDGAPEWLPHGGVLVRDGGEVEAVGAARPTSRVAVAS